ncbi:MAG: hypothetical protein BLM47_03495 [Candidatus Reconcilbacillus cellulovorans]|uniref:peptidylprolyl isomerase n=1 Tax=Candidatus Reconcilbacillus cellulovorans TaxID=1906605 RepID=A0A2A6E226_9BACL|nr:MAG: hypothetical protein BLM47_03495 [Candidatus Reconcilbacillus cellulovorans]
MRKCGSWWLLAGLAFLFLSAWALAQWGMSPGFQSGPGPSATPSPSPADKHAVAEVGGKSITESDLKSYLLKRYAREALQVLIDRETVRLEAEQLGLSVSREELEAELRDMQEGYESEEQFYRTMLEQLGMTREELEEDVKYRLLLEKIAIFSIQVSQSEIDAYIRDHPEQFREYTRFHLLKIAVRTKEQADVVLDELREGADFEQVARERSMDETSALAGGDIGWIDEHDPFTDPAILETAKRLAVGQTSGAVAVEGGYVILKLKDKQVVNRMTPEEKHRKARKEVALQKAPPLSEVLASLREKHRARIVDPAYLEGDGGTARQF